MFPLENKNLPYLVPNCLHVGAFIPTSFGSLFTLPNAPLYRVLDGGPIHEHC